MSLMGNLQTNQAQSVFGGIAEAKTSKGGVYPIPGNYLCQIEAVKMVTSRARENLFCVEFYILESDEETRPVGSRMSWMANLTRHDAALGNIKSFLGGTTGLPRS